MADATTFQQATGSPWFLTAGDEATMQRYLRQLGFLRPRETVRNVSSAGEGNMNVTLRVFTNRRHFIVKQSRPWVAKFPDLTAPVERILVERDFLRHTQQRPATARASPQIRKADGENFVLIIEDLGQAADLTTLYAAGVQLADSELTTLLEYAGTLHRLEVEPDYPRNRGLRELNHAHIFELPFRADNGFPLDALHPGLARVAQPLREDERLARRARELGALYLADNSDTLIHGDFYPGSFLRVSGRLYVIDGEFSHRGRPEFDLGVLLGHLLLAGAPERQLHLLDTAYRRPPGFDGGLVRQFAYVEVIRRIIGIAQLPLAISLDERQALLESARAGLL